MGHHEEISWKDKHGHHHHDYKAHPKYKFAYGVDDKHTKDYHGQKEHRDGTYTAKLETLIERRQESVPRLDFVLLIRTLN